MVVRRVGVGCHPLDLVRAMTEVNRRRGLVCLAHGRARSGSVAPRPASALLSLAARELAADERAVLGAPCRRERRSWTTSRPPEVSVSLRRAGIGRWRDAAGLPAIDLGGDGLRRCARGVKALVDALAAAPDLHPRPLLARPRAHPSNCQRERGRRRLAAVALPEGLAVVLVVTTGEANPVGRCPAECLGHADPRQ